MCRMIIMLINIIFFSTYGKSQGTNQPSSIGLEKILEWNALGERICTLPPQPDDGSYVVVNEPGARPGDSFQNVTLIQYSTDERNRLVQINTFVCSLGEWYLKMLRYVAEDNIFNAGSCPLLCANSSNGRSSPKKKAESSKVIKEEVQPPNLCKLPEYPQNGWYEVANEPKAKPGETLTAVYLIYRCKLRYKIEGNKSVVCFNGLWYGAAPKCNKEPPHAEVSGSLEESTLSTTRCLLPQYPKNGQYLVLNIPQASPGEIYETLNLRYSCDRDSKLVGNRKIYCIKGAWSSKLPKCVRCGFIINTKAGNSSSALLPWHVGIYYNSSTSYKRICGGSIIATNLVMSAASCFWTEAEGILSAARFAVAAGKLYRGWNNDRDIYAQKSDVSKIAIPTRFRGALTNFQSDIALVFLTKPMDYNDYVAPVCIDFNNELDEEQLKSDNVGKLGVWDGNNENDEESRALQVKELAYIDINKCITDASSEFRLYITSDKICAGDTNGTELCESHRGEGLVFPAMDEGGVAVNHYLRGIIPAAPKNDELCNRRIVYVFTQITAHEPFLKFHLDSAIW